MATQHHRALSGANEPLADGGAPPGRPPQPVESNPQSESEFARAHGRLAGRRGVVIALVATLLGAASAAGVWRAWGVVQGDVRNAAVDGSENEENATIDSLAAPEVVDLGEAPIHGVVPYEIELRNTAAEAPLRLEHIFSTCGCTTTTPAPVILPAGERGTVSGEFTLPEAVSRSAAASTVYIGTSETSRKRVRLRATVVNPFPDEVALRADGAVVIPLHKLYRAGVRDVACYAGVSDTPLPLALSDDRSEVRVDAPAAAETLDLVLTMAGAGDAEATHKIAQQVRLAPADGAMKTSAASREAAVEH